ncbi:MAG TPA: putative Ig domain-containing protein, partial [Bryobacteraceae bacterium]|nr:putative Ig domain-containing protein [Bryobacteraceae bacterium]
MLMRHFGQISAALIFAGAAFGQVQINISPASLAAATAGTPYSQALTASGGVGTTYTWSAQLVGGGSLPSWLTLDPSAGVLSGTPPANGTLAITVKATDVQSNFGQAGMTLLINFASTVITTNLPAGMAIVNISGVSCGSDSTDPTRPCTAAVGGNGAAASGGTNQSTWFQPFNSLGQLLEYTIPQAGTYTFRVISPTDAAVAFPNLTAGQLSSMWTAWTYNNPWLTDYLAFRTTAIQNSSESQIFSGAGGVPNDANGANFTAAYNYEISNNLYNLIYPGARDATPQTTFTFDTPTTLVFALPDNQVGDNAGGVSVLIAPAAVAPLNIITTSLSGAGVGVPYPPAQFNATGGSGIYQWSVTGLPPGLTLSASGVLSGTPTSRAGSPYTETFTVTDPVSGLSFTQPTPFRMNVSPPSPPLSITTSSLPPGETGLPYSATVAATGGFGAYTWSISAEAPLSINSATGQLTSTGVLGSGNLPQFTVTVSDTAGDSVAQNFTVTVDSTVTVTTTSLPSAGLNESYGVQLGASNGTGGYTWTIATGSLPLGLTLSTDGLISGKPTSPVSFGFSAQVTDSSRAVATSQNLAITVTQPVSYVVVNQNSGGLVGVTGNGSTVATISGAAGGYDVAQDAGGNFVVASIGSLQRVTPLGVATTIANAPPGSAWIGVAADGSGNFIVGDNMGHEIWRVSSDGLTKTPVATYQVSAPADLEDIKVAVDASGNYIVAHDNSAFNLIKITPAGVITSITLSGQTLPQQVGGLTFDSNGNYMVLDYTLNTIFQITPAGIVSVFAGSVAVNAQALGIARNPLTNEYIIGLSSGALNKVSADGQTVSTLVNDVDGLPRPEGIVALAGDYPSSVAATNPLGYFRMETASGTSEVNGYTFTMAPGASVATPGAPTGNPANNFASLDGSGTAGVTTSLTGNITTAASIAAWVNLRLLPAESGTFQYIAGESQVNNDFDLQFGSDNVLGFYTTSNSAKISYAPDTSTLAGQWHMVVATFDATAGTRALYWDGARVASDTAGSQPNKSTAFQIGSSSPTFSGRNFNGGIDEVGLWNYALSPGQVYRMFIARGAASGNPITSLSPSSTPLNSAATNVTISGSGFVQGATVRWTSPAGQTSFLTPTSITASQITVSAPANLLTTAGDAQVSVANAAGVPANELPFTITSSGPLSIAPDSIPDGQVGVPYSTVLTASGGSGNYSWSIPPEQPRGVNLTVTPIGSGQTATLSGTPSVEYTDDVRVTVQLNDLTTDQS